MSNKVFKYQLPIKSSHNNVIITPIVDGIILRSVRVITIEDGELFIYNEAHALDTAISIKYPTITTSSIFIEITHDFADELELERLVEVSLTLNDYKFSGSYAAKEGRLSFNKYVSLISEIENEKDSYIQANLGCIVADKYDNTLYRFNALVGLSNDNFLVKKVDSYNGIIELPYQPKENSVRVIVEGDDINEFTIDDTNIVVDIPKGSESYIIYQPFFIDIGGFSKISDVMMINSSNEILLKDEYCETIYYNLSIEVYNTDISNSNHSPIIKSLAIITSE